MKPQYTVHPNLRRYLHHLTTADKWFYLCVKDLCEDNHCAMSLRKLSKETGLGKTTIHRSIHKLQDTGLIVAQKKVRPTGGGEVWHITLTDFNFDELSTIKQAYDIIPPRKLADEQKRLDFQLERAKEAGLSATLSLEEWITTLQHFNWKCAYCGGNYDLIEHFIPLVLGGGTVVTNCVPACTSCNNRKNSHHPFLIPSTSGIGESMHRVHEYLTSRNHMDSEAVYE
jgi:predicted transcriptional regulator